MKNPIAVLGRLFRRSEMPSAVVSALYTQAIGRPLMIHPEMGAQLIEGYLRGGVIEASEPLMAVDVPMGSPRAKSQHVAVLNITGPLIDRPQPGLCDDGPASYEAIREAFDAQMADDSVTAIIFRMRSPGGMVDGCFDLTDHIHASRGTKPIVAVVDNMAYSAAYAIASACDEIYVSRTGGVGSVGVYGYHLDMTEAYAQAGMKVSLIYAGDHKVEFSPHVQLSDDARAREQAIIDDMYGLFVSSVAKYRGMDVEAVIATQAGTFNGQAAIDAGMATHLGTMRDALAALAESDEQRSAREASEARSRAEADRAIAVQAVVAANPKADIMAALLDSESSITAATVGDRLAHAQSVVDLCTAAGDRSLAHEYIVKGTNIDVVRKQLGDMKAQDGPELVTTHPKSQKTRAAIASHDIYESRRRAAAASAGQ